MVASTRAGQRRPACGRGFTLVDALFVTAIIAILLALAIPQYDAVLKKAQTAEVSRVFADQRRELEVYRAEHDSYGDAQAASSDCGVAMPEGRFFKFRCVTRHERGADLGYLLTAIPRAVLSASPEATVSAALFSVNQDGERASASLVMPAGEMLLACLPAEPVSEIWRPNPARC